MKKRIKRKMLQMMFSFFLVMVMILSSAVPAMAILGTCDSHNFSPWETEVSATCDRPGTMFRICEYCGYEEQQTIPRKEHEFGSWITVLEPTCTNHGEHVAYCYNCGIEIREAIGLIPHNYGEWRTIQNATCTQEGQQVSSCSMCGREITETLNRLSHNFGGWIIERESTCTQEGQRKRTCTMCGYTQTEVIAKKPHDLNEGYMEVVPGPFHTGIERLECEICGEHYVNEIDPEGTLRRGDRGDEVRTLQKLLNDAGYDCGNPDGIFGARTEEALIRYGRDHGAPTDGIAYPGFFYMLCSDGESRDALWLELIYEGDINHIYEVGEVIPLKWRLTNVSGKEVSDWQVYTTSFVDYRNSLLAGKDGSVLSHMQSVEGEWNVLVDEASAVKAQGEDYYGCLPVMLGACGIGADGDNLEAYQVRAFDVKVSETETDADHEINFSINAVNEPLNGEYYEEGEEIKFKLVLQNNTNEDLKDVLLSAPLKGLVQDTIVDGCEALEPGTSFSGEFTYIVTKSAAYLGSIPVEGYATWNEGSKVAMIQVPTGGNVVADESSQKELNNEYYAVNVPGNRESLLIVDKTEMSTPENGSYYQEGEVIRYKITCINTHDSTLRGISVFDVLAADQIGSIEQLEPETCYGCYYEHKVSAMDVERGYVVNYATVNYTADSQVGTVFYTQSNEVYSPTSDQTQMDTDEEYPEYGEDIEEPEDPENIEDTDEEYPEYGEDLQELTIEKREISTPANEQYYEFGETIRYEISITNIGDKMMSGIFVYDSLSDTGEEIGRAEQFMPGETRTIEFEYVVTAGDVNNGMVMNSAVATYPGEDALIFVQSNYVHSPTGASGFGVEEDSFMEDTEDYFTEYGEMLYDGKLTIEKKEISTPENGSYYQEGEIIRYQISYQNVGDEMIGETIIFDFLSDTDIAYAEHLYPGEQRTCEFEYTVLAQDVQNGRILNYAMALFDMETYMGYAQSNDVYSPTGEDMKLEPVAPVIVTDESTEASDCCVKTLKEHGDTDIVYELHYCKTHEATLTAVNTMVEAANTTEAKISAWEYGRNLWKENMDELYQAIWKAANSTAKALVMKEQILFETQVINHEVVLNKLYPESPEYVAKVIAWMYKDHCSELCYELHTAPENRKDDLLQMPRKERTEEPMEICAVDLTTVDSANYICKNSFCNRHSIANSMTEALLAKDSSKETWKFIETIWDTELTKHYKSFKTRLNEEDQKLLTVDLYAYMQWLEAREEFLNFMYPGMEEIPAQVTVRAMIERVHQLCRDEK